jgi:hypothetical protein
VKDAQAQFSVASCILSFLTVAPSSEAENISDAHDASWVDGLVSLGAVKEAQAKDLALIIPGSPVVIVDDIPRKKQKCEENFLSDLFGNFASAFTQAFVKRIESNFRVANFLYYSDAVAVAQYVPDYLNKYIDNPQDRQLIQQFIKPISCGKSTVDMRPIFRARARQYLGFDPSTLDPSDPNFFSKVAKVGSVQSQTSGQQFNIETVADDALGAALTAINQEFTSSGSKTPRNTTTSNPTISVSNTAITKSLQSNLQALLDIGSGNSGESVASIITRAIIQIFYNSFVFKGAVIKEQQACVNTPQFNPVTPASTTDSTPPTQGTSACAPTDDACKARELLNQ